MTSYFPRVHHFFPIISIEFGNVLCFKDIMKEILLKTKIDLSFKIQQSTLNCIVKNTTK